MTQLVFNNDMTAHVWAQQEQDSGRSHTGNFYFEGRSIYSYGSHYVAGYVAPGPLYLTNRKSSSVTTNGKHMPAVNRAIDYGRGKYSNSGAVPDLTSIAAIFDSLLSAGQSRTKVEARKRLTQHIETGHGTWPGVDMAARLYVAMGLSPDKARSKAKAGHKRVERATTKRKAKIALEVLNRDARAAKHLAAKPPGDTAQSVRGYLVKASVAYSWQGESALRYAQEESRGCFRAAKAAKAKGWTRVAKACREHYKAARAELKRYETGRELFVDRRRVRDAIATIRQIPERLEIVGDMSRYSHGVEAPGLGKQESQLRAMGEAYDTIRAALLTVAASKYARITNGPAWQDSKAGESDKIRELQEQAESKAGAILVERQAGAAQAWRDTGARPPYGMGRLQDSEGGALLRVDGVERDDSGDVIGGTLATSWAATVPLVHAIKAFRFLKLCRAKGTPWVANGQTLRVGHFRIESIDAKGNFRAACHLINWQEVARIAESLGLSGIAGADTTEGRAIA